MQSRKNDLSILGMGCMRLPSGYEAAEKLVLQAVQSGVNFLDTAYIYPGSEATLGRILAENRLRDSVYIASKLPLMFVRGPKDFDKYFSKQLERLRTDRIDYYLMHAIGDLDTWKTLVSWGIGEWIAEKKEAGQIGKIGFSFHGPRDAFMALLEAYPWEFCLIQLNYSDENYQAGILGMKRAAEMGMAVIAMEPLLGGKLADGLPKRAKEILQEANPDRTPAAWALHWLFDKPEISVVLSGMSHPDQLTGNVRSANASSAHMLTEAELEVYARVKHVFAETDKVPCTSCGYCMPCPARVDIPACFSAYNASFAGGKFAGIRQYIMSTGAMGAVQGRASQCVACGKCEPLCPQHIRVTQALRDVRGRLEPWWYAAGISVARSVMGKNRK